MATANDIMDAAYIKCGIRSPNTTDYTEALVALNNMIGSWSADIIIPHTTREAFDLTVGVSGYTIGSGYDFDTVRPMSIITAYLKDTDDYCYSLKALSPKDYNKIGLKTIEGRPTGFYYYPNYPAAAIVFSKEPDEVYEYNFDSIKPLTEFASKTTTVSLPNEYKEGLVYNLSIRLAENNSIELPQSVIALAQATYLALSRLTAINMMPPIARFDFGTGEPSNIVTGE